jgi:hypothetical protein
VSGGGGWGIKQGLLSLDPQTRYNVGDDADVDSFIRSFTGEASPEGILSPRFWIQFFVELSPPELSPSDITNNHCPMPSIIFGTSSTNSEARSTSGTPVEVIEEHFGGVSAAGLFLEATPQPGDVLDEQGPIHTKIDTPNSYVWEGSRRWL